MAVDTEEEHLRQLAFLEFNLLRHFNESHLEGLRGAEISAENTVLWDLNGQPLLHRHALIRDDKGVGFIDVGVQRHSLALFQTASRNTWDPDSLIARAETEAKRLLPERSFSAARFVCYSFPRVAVQLLDGEGAEVLMLSVALPSTASWLFSMARSSRRSSRHSCIRSRLARTPAHAT